MQTRHDRRERVGSAVGAGEAANFLHSGERSRGASRRLSKEALIHLRHTLVLVDRFRLLCVLHSDSGAFAEVLQVLIATWCEGFKIFDALHSQESGIELARFRRDRAECLQELEMLLLGLRQRVPTAVRGVEHALDNLIVQCVLCEAMANAGNP